MSKKKIILWFILLIVVLGSFVFIVWRCYSDQIAKYALTLFLEQAGDESSYDEQDYLVDEATLIFQNKRTLEFFVESIPSANITETSGMSGKALPIPMYCINDRVIGGYDVLDIRLFYKTFQVRLRGKYKDSLLEYVEFIRTAKSAMGIELGKDYAVS